MIVLMFLLTAGTRADVAPVDRDGVRKLSETPPSGIHPRVFFTGREPNILQTKVACLHCSAGGLQNPRSVLKRLSTR